LAELKRFSHLLAHAASLARGVYVTVLNESQLAIMQDVRNAQIVAKLYAPMI